MLVDIGASLPFGLFLLCQQLQVARAFVWLFSTKRFQDNALIAAGNLGIGSSDRILAFGDFNGDQFLDVVVLEDDQKTFSVYRWQHEMFKFQKASSIRNPTIIHNMVPSDYNHDGRLDILVMTQDPIYERTSMWLYLADERGEFNSNGIQVVTSTAAQPIPLDMNGDLMVDLLGLEPESHSIKLWRNMWNGTGMPSSPFTLVDPPFDETPCEIANPHSNAVVDFDGDCLADIFLLCKPKSSFSSLSYQIWVNHKTEGYSLGATGSLPSNAGQIVFADMDRDGTMDLVFPSCDSISRTTGIGTDCYINIVYNQQLPLCQASYFSGIIRGNCREPGELCNADPSFKFEFVSDPKSYTKIPVSDLFPEQKKSPGLLLYDTTFNPPVPRGIQLGDANHDGFPDLLLITAGDPHGGFLGVGGAADRTPALALSQPCKKGLVGCDRLGHGATGYSVVSKNAEALSVIKDAAAVSFIDIDEDGTLDILVQRTGQQGAGTSTFIQNNFFYDAFFLKAIVLNGACGNSLCVVPNSSISYMPFGVSYSGATFKYTILDTNGKRSGAQAVQLPQTSYQSLQAPYSFIGLGRTNNYIENFFVGSTIHANEHFINMEGVIPNSKVVFKPPPMLDGEKQGEWRKELYLRPGEWIPWVTVAVVGTTIVLAFIVLMLHLNEKREDEKERRRVSHMINFDAL